MKYLKIYQGENPVSIRVEKDLIPVLTSKGMLEAKQEADFQFILNFTQFSKPEAVHRRKQNEFVVSIAVLEDAVGDLKQLCYNTLVKTLSNLVICVIEEGKRFTQFYCVTPEVGFYKRSYSGEAMYQAMQPIITAHFAINNQIRYDLPEQYRSTTITRQLKQYGARLDQLGVLPAPFPMHEILSPENINHIYKIFNIKGLSYGNLSARERIPEVGQHTFWMTARGVDKSNLQGVGKDILLVEGYDKDSGEIKVCLPPQSDPLIRVSVDAIEHFMIYRQFPEVGAIVHVHAWMHDILYTEQNYPCGTIELAKEVVGLLKLTKNPDEAVVGLKNHGLTITGPTLKNIFDRIEGKLLNEVPMMV